MMKNLQEIPGPTMEDNIHYVNGIRKSSDWLWMFMCDQFEREYRDCNIGIDYMIEFYKKEKKSVKRNILHIEERITYLKSKKESIKNGK